MKSGLEFGRFSAGRGDFASVHGQIEILPGGWDQVTSPSSERETTDHEPFERARDSRLRLTARIDTQLAGLDRGVEPPSGPVPRFAAQEGGRGAEKESPPSTPSLSLPPAPPPSLPSSLHLSLSPSLSLSPPPSLLNSKV